VASTIAEETNNTIGVAGLAFRCAIMPIKVLDANGEGDDFDVAEGIDHAVTFSSQGGSRPVKVINLSLGGPGDARVLRDAVSRAVAAGITVVAAAGNDDEADVGFPAGYPNVIAVGAIDARKRRASYSNFGPDLDIVAPGGDVRSFNDFDAIWQQDFDPDLAAIGIFDDFILLGDIGTSMAAPHVAAVAALIYRQGVTDPRAVAALIETTAEDLGAAGRDDQFGHGMIRPDRALAGLGLNR
jgi:serine protease